MQTNPASGIFVQRLITHMPNWVSPLVITPASPSGEAFQADDKIIPVKVFHYAPRKWQLIAHNPGGIPVALRKNKLLYLLLPIFLLSEFFSTIKHSFRAQLIHANWSINGFIAGLVGSLLRKPVVTTLRGEDITRAMKYSLDLFILRCCVRLNSRIICVNYSYKDWLLDIFPDAHRKIITIENGVDNRFLLVGKSRLASQKVNPNSVLRLLTVGSLIKRKRIHDIITALKNSGDEKIVLTIAGDGPENDDLHRLVNHSRLQDRVTFTGPVQLSSLLSLLESHDAFVLSSESEGRPNVILEAMACGLPVLATRLAGITEFITDNVNGLLYDTGSVDQLLTLIMRIKENHELKASLGSAAYEYINKHNLTWDHSAKQYADLYQSVLPCRNTAQA